MLNDIAGRLIKLYHPKIWVEYWWRSEEECARTLKCASHEEHKHGYIYLSDTKGSLFWLAVTAHQIEAFAPHPNLVFKHTKYELVTTDPAKSEYRIYKWNVGQPNSFANLKTIIESYIEARCASTQ